MERLRYSREELEALRDANLEAPPLSLGFDPPPPSMYTQCCNDVDTEASSRGKRNKRKINRPTKGERRAKKLKPICLEGEDDDVLLEDDEDGDFGGMFDEGDIFQGVFLDGQGENVSAAAENGDYEDDEEDYDEGPVQKVAFVVEGEPDFEKEEPDDGWEYVRRVKWEAARCPGVVVATIPPEKLVDKQTQYVPVVPAITPCDPQLLPSKDWETRFLHSFSDLRTKFETWKPPEELSKPVPHMKDDSAWKALCFGKADNNSSSSTQAVPIAELDEFGAGPLVFYKGELNTLLNLDEVSRASLLQRHVAWLKDMDHLPRERAVWLFALTAAVDKPIDADTSFALRTLLRNCGSIRALRKFECDRELQLLNMIITVAGKYFGQDDSNCF